MAPSIALSILPEAHDKPLSVLDPMMGSGTTAVIARSRGHLAFGFDTDPLAVTLSKAWVTDINEKSILKTAESVLDEANLSFRRIKQRDAYPVDASDETKMFIRYWFDVTNRKQLRCLSDAIHEVRQENIRNALWCAFSRLIIAKKNGASWAMDLSHSRPHKVSDKELIRPITTFHKEVRTVLKNIPFRTNDGALPKASVLLGDARSIPLPDSSIDVVITSPPYLNAIDYIRCSKFTLVWMGYQIPKLSSLRAANIGSEVSSGVDETDRMVSEVLHSMGIIDELPSKQRRILARYVIDMDGVIKEIARVLKSTGKTIFVVGNSSMKGIFIQNSEALKRICRRYHLCTISETIRPLPTHRRYLPPPSLRKSGKSFRTRMNEEVILTMAFN
jgi:DNA modification methylase